MVLAKDTLVFVVRVPLVNKVDFTLYKMIPIPHQLSNHTFFHIRIPYMYLMTSIAGDEFVLGASLDGCISIEKRSRICEGLSIHHSRNDAPCKVQLRNNETPDNCEVQQARNHAPYESHQMVIRVHLTNSCSSNLRQAGTRRVQTPRIWVAQVITTLQMLYIKNNIDNHRNARATQPTEM